ncbi:hypothetical protein BpHYR1_011349 [Brachionus plicatilis]|uniref:Uncharacterized protein n=1 Tax=Brachionus plicatilis TaxID=10195 RepID=A0A3M7SM19_BRAPC|nr:hypothetical protein BpHYR1_011349 [Brachionus plicatilis]
MDDSILSKNILDFDMVSKTFVTEIRDETEEFKSAINKNDNDSMPEYVHSDDIYFDFDKVLGYRIKEGKNRQ